MSFMKCNWFLDLCVGSAIIGGAIPASLSAEEANSPYSGKPNVIYIMADDLGIGDLGCYGQRQIQTPAIDRLVANGMRFLQHYSGSTVSAPSRCCLMTGKHTGHAAIRGNHAQIGSDGLKYDSPLPASEITVASIMKENQYKTACFGKWGMGAFDNEGSPRKHGFDYFFGYLGQGRAHFYYPDFLFENEQKVKLDKKVYSHDLIMKRACQFIDENADRPFFIYLTPTLPHAELAVPEGELGIYENAFEEKPYVGSHYCSQAKPKATYAAMVSRLDKDVQVIVDLLKKKGIYENTLLIFTSDNGTHREGGHMPEYFNSNGEFRGIKRDLYEGGIRTPFIVQWPGHVKAGTTSAHVSAFWDFLPTMCDLVGAKLPQHIDGISYLPSLLGKKQVSKHSHLYFEFHEGGGKQAVIKDDWKLIRFNVNKPDKTYYELYNLKKDHKETNNRINQEEEKVKELIHWMDHSRTPNAIFKFKNEKY